MKTVSLLDLIPLLKRKELQLILRKGQNKQMREMCLEFGWKDGEYNWTRSRIIAYLTGERIPKEQKYDYSTSLRKQVMNKVSTLNADELQWLTLRLLGYSAFKIRREMGLNYYTFRNLQNSVKFVMNEH